MTTELTRRVVRATAERDHRTGKPLIVELTAGGRLVRMRVKGTRRWYTLTYKQMWMAAAANRAAEMRAEKKARRQAARVARGLV